MTPVSDPNIHNQPSHQGPAQGARSTADMSHVDAHGAVDLTAAGAPAPRSPSAAPAPGHDEVGVRLDVPLIAQADESTFETVMSTSRTVPVVVVLWSSRALASRGALDVMEGLARDNAGRFQLVEIDAETSPAIAQAFQVQGFPTVVALVAGRPVPLFQGEPVREQVQPVIDQLLEASAQMGVTGAVAVSAEDTETPVPEEHRAPLDAEAAGDLAGAVEGWEKVVDHNPRDEAAKSELARVRVALRSRQGADATDPADRADALFAAGDHAGAFDILLQLIADTQGEERDAARVRLIDLFRVAGNAPEVRAARQKLSALLLV